MERKEKIFDTEKFANLVARKVCQKIQEEDNENEEE